jgi:hypothetical protein
MPRDSPPVKGLASVDQMIKRPDSLLHRNRRIRSVRKDHIDVIQTQPLQTIVQPFDQVFPAQSSGVEFFSAGPEEDFGRDDVVGSLPAHLVEHSAHLDFGVSFGVSPVLLIDTDCVGSDKR